MTNTPIDIPGLEKYIIRTIAVMNVQKLVDHPEKFTHAQFQEAMDELDSLGARLMKAYDNGDTTLGDFIDSDALENISHYRNLLIPLFKRRKS